MLEMNTYAISVRFRAVKGNIYQFLVSGNRFCALEQFRGFDSYKPVDFSQLRKRIKAEFAYLRSKIHRLDAGSIAAWAAFGLQGGGFFVLDVFEAGTLGANVIEPVFHALIRYSSRLDAGGPMTAVGHLCYSITPLFECLGIACVV